MASNVATTKVNLESELVVIGAGGGGLAAAVTAAERGVRVALLEKRHTAGGNTFYAAGLFAAETTLQTRMNLDVRKDECFKVAMDYAHYRLNGKLLRAFLDKSPDTVKWLENKGIKFTRIFTWYPNQKLRSQHCADNFGANVTRLLVDDCKNLGVQLFYKTAAKKLLTDGAGKISGVLATQGNTSYEIKTKSVVIASGGFGGNKRLLKKYFPFYTDAFVSRGLPLMGDGILMAAAIGAANEGTSTLQMEGPFFPGFGPLWRVAQEPTTLWVNKKGERFIDETTAHNDFESVNGMLQQPGKISYTLFDERMKQDFIRNGCTRILGRPFTEDSLEKDIVAYAGKGGVKSSDSWDLIAEWIGANPEELKATIEEYNFSCDRGYDEIFVKDRRHLIPLRTPPYYALKCYPSYLTTIGGIKINHRMEVLDKDDNPIPGLFAAGNDTGGWEMDTYNAILTGTTVAFALSSGRICGENAQKYIAGN